MGERRYPSPAAIVGICLIGLSILTGCGGDDDGDAGEQRSEVERIVQDGLNRKLGRLLNESATVKHVTCTRAGGHRYECIANASEPTGEEGTKTVPILVAATCDEQNCLWRVQTVGAEETNMSRAPSPESLRTFHNPSLGMEPTLKPGQAVEVDLGAYDSEDPAVGDIVIFHPPEGVNRPADKCGVSHAAREACPVPSGNELVNELFIKRVVAEPGDQLAVENGHVVLDGVSQREGFIRPCPRCDLPIPIEVPPGHIFLMGDNRGASDDSRFWGPIPQGWVVGKVVDH